MIMEKKDLRIVYMGTPEFAVESLRRLVDMEVFCSLALSNNMRCRRD